MIFLKLGPDERAQLKRDSDTANLSLQTAANAMETRNEPWLHLCRFLFLCFPLFFKENYTNFKAMTNSHPNMNSELLCNCPKTGKKWFVARYESTAASLPHSHSVQVQMNEYSLWSRSSLPRLCHVWAMRTRLDPAIHVDILQSMDTQTASKIQMCVFIRLKN